MSNDLKFNVILDGAYPYVPHASERASNYIDLPNKHYDPVLGQHILEDQLETLAQLERFGFDGAVVSEQHNGRSAFTATQCSPVPGWLRGRRRSTWSSTARS